MNTVVYSNKRKKGNEKLITKIYNLTVPTNPLEKSYFRLDEVPLRHITNIIKCENNLPTTILLQEQIGGNPTSNKFVVDYDMGLIYVNPSDNINQIKVSYLGTGSVLLASDLNYIIQHLDGTGSGGGPGTGGSNLTAGDGIDINNSVISAKIDDKSIGFIDGKLFVKENTENVKNSASTLPHYLPLNYVLGDKFLVEDDKRIYETIEGYTLNVPTFFYDNIIINKENGEITGFQYSPDVLSGIGRNTDINNNNEIIIPFKTSSDISTKQCLVSYNHENNNMFSIFISSENLYFNSEILYGLEELTNYTLKCTFFIQNNIATVNIVLMRNLNVVYSNSHVFNYLFNNNVFYLGYYKSGVDCYSFSGIVYRELNNNLLTIIDPVIIYGLTFDSGKPLINNKVYINTNEDKIYAYADNKLSIFSKSESPTIKHNENSDIDLIIEEGNHFIVNPTSTIGLPDLPLYETGYKWNCLLCNQKQYGDFQFDVIRQTITIFPSHGFDVNLYPNSLISSLVFTRLLSKDTNVNTQWNKLDSNIISKYIQADVGGVVNIDFLNAHYCYVCNTLVEINSLNLNFIENTINPITVMFKPSSTFTISSNTQFNWLNKETPIFEAGKTCIITFKNLNAKIDYVGKAPGESVIETDKKIIDNESTEAVLTPTQGYIYEYTKPLKSLTINSFESTIKSVGIFFKTDPNEDFILTTEVVKWYCITQPTFEKDEEYVVCILNGRGIVQKIGE